MLISVRSLIISAPIICISIALYGADIEIGHPSDSDGAVAPLIQRDSGNTEPDDIIKAPKDPTDRKDPKDPKGPQCPPLVCATSDQIK